MNHERRIMTNKKLLKSTGIISFATTTSRILGFIRDILFAKMFGTGIFAQAFVVAFRLPNMLRDMVGEGATDAALVPILTEYQHTRSKEEYWEVARVILNLMLVVLVVLSAAGVVFAPFLVRVIAPGFIRDAQKFEATVALTRIVFPYILLLGMVAYSKGVLNSFHSFAAPAFSPVVLNITLISAITMLCPVIGVRGMAIGVLVGGFFEVLVQIRPLVKNGFRFKEKFKITHPIVKRIGKLLFPRMLGTAVYQLSVLMDTVLASLAWIVGNGGVAAMYYSIRLTQLPLAVFGIALATAALPKMSKEVASNDMEKFKNTVAFSLRNISTVMIPATVGFLVLARPIVRILFQRGEFTAYSTNITTSVLIFYSLGLLSFAGIKILVGAYYSMGDTRTPAKTAAISLGVNLVLNLILMWPLKIGGLALATSIAATGNLIILYVILSRRIGDIGIKRITLSFMRVCISSVIMGVFTFVTYRLFLYSPNPSKTHDIFVLIGIVFGSCIVYLVAAYITKVEAARKIVGLVLEKNEKKYSV